MLVDRTRRAIVVAVLALLSVALGAITPAKADKLVNRDFLNVLLVAGYLLGGTICIVLLASWALRRFGKRRK